MGDNKIKRYYFVDMENVHRSGLKGIDKLTSKDCVRIYYSNPLENIPIILMKQMMHSSAKYEYIEVEVPIKNAADCMILFDLRDIASENKKAEYIIISNDTDFDKPIEDFKKKKINVKKQVDLQSSSKQNSDEKTPKKPEPAPNNKPDKLEKKSARELEVRSFINEHFKNINITGNRNSVIERTIQVILKGKSRSQINNDLMQIYDRDSIKMIFDEIKPLIKDLPGK